MVEIGLPVEDVEEDGAMREGGMGNSDDLCPVEPIEGLRDE